MEVMRRERSAVRRNLDMQVLVTVRVLPLFVARSGMVINNSWEVPSPGPRLSRFLMSELMIAAVYDAEKDKQFGNAATIIGVNKSESEK